MEKSPEVAHVESLRRTASDVAKINDFIISLLEDPARLTKFREDPDSLLKEAGVSPQVGEVLKFGDRLAVLREATGGVSPQVFITFGQNVVIVSSRVTITIESNVIQPNVIQRK